MGDKLDSSDSVIARTATQQHGVVTHRQLRDAGLSRSAIAKRAQRGRLHRLHRGVYAVGHAAPSHEQRWMAAILACGSGAALSHGSAAVLWDLLRPLRGPIDVSVPTQVGRATQAGIHLHRCASLRSDDVTRRRGIPVTTPALTIADLKAALSPKLLRRAIRQAEMQGFSLGPGVETDRTRSDLERDFLRLCRRHGLSEPQVNVRIGRWTVDFLWPAKRLVVETDSHRWHRGSVAFEDDHVRDLDLRRRGYAVSRFTERQIREDAAEVVADLREALGLAS
jgi:very-short-patch-repair endonuclease